MRTGAHVGEPADRGVSLRVTASLDVLAEVRAFVRSAVVGLGADIPAANALVQSVDEWATNVVVHGYRGAPGPLEIGIRRDGTDIVVDVRDEASAFDPANAPPFDPALPLAERPLGGMGIALIKDLCAVFEHRALPDLGNEVTMRRAALTTHKPAGHEGGRQ